MASTLFHLFGLPIRAFGLCMALGFLSAWWIAGVVWRERGRLEADLSSLVSWTMISGVLGARVAYILEHWSAEFANNPMAMVRIDQGGLMFYGGLIGAAAVLTFFNRLKRWSLIETSDIVLMVLPLGQAFGRIGCFLNGCCHGRLVSHWGIVYPKDSPAYLLQCWQGLIPPTAAQALPVFPSQLLEATCALSLFVALFLLRKRLQRFRGAGTALYLAGYGIIRFLVELTRGDSRMDVGPFSISQFISLLLIGTAVAIALAHGREWREARRA